LSETRRLLRVLKGEALSPPPVWIMRQAGRYLPEYREVRARAGSFLDLCYNPELAAEVTLQPIRRYGFDAAILFSDILVVPDALGQEVRFEEGRGPLLEPIDLARLDPLLEDDPEAVAERLAPVYETVARVRDALPPETTLLGFCGAPWTVATYMIAGHGTPDQAPARRAMLEAPDAFARLVERLARVSAAYLVRQLRAGADAVQVFDTWAGALDGEGFESFAIAPARTIVEEVRAQVPGARIIGFPKGAGARLEAYAAGTGVDAVGLDWQTPLGSARQAVGPRVATQGNLDPMRVIVGGDALARGVDAILAETAGTPHVFNLGHGVTPETPPEHVAALVSRVRKEAP